MTWRLDHSGRGTGRRWRRAGVVSGTHSDPAMTELIAPVRPGAADGPAVGLRAAGVPRDQRFSAVQPTRHAETKAISLRPGQEWGD